jgi:hypothetical protein
MANSDKDTIYVDIDDEITGIIDKVKNSKGKVIAVVLPKRATVFQSVVNMKLLKRAVDADKKNLVLITSEAGLLPLAGAAGIHVAKTLTSRPEIPSAPKAFVDNDEAIDEDTGIGSPDDTELDQNQPVGQLAGDAAAGAAGVAAADGVETLMLDNSDPVTDTAADAAKDTPAGKKKDKKSKKDKSKAIPNFGKFRLFLIIGGVVLVVLIVLFFILNSSLKKATISVTTNATNVDATLSLNLETGGTFDSSSSTLPAKIEQQQKSYQQTVNTTGQKNEGNEATGTITMSVQSCSGTIPSVPADVPAGTGVSANSQTYITQQDTSFDPSFGGSGHCVTYKSTSTTPVTAQSPGSAYNVSGVNFTVAGRSEITANGSASGGTDNIVQTVNQNDINNAKAKISTGTSTSAKSTLESELKSSGYYPIDATFTSASPNVTSSAQVGQAASSVTVTEDLNYSMFGVPKGNLNTLVNTAIKNQIDTSKQNILDNGINTAKYSVENQTSSNAQVSMAVVAVAGPELNINTIKQNAEGHKAGDIQSQLSTNPNVTGVTVKFSPFWVSSAPGNPSKIKVDIAKPANK